MPRRAGAAAVLTFVILTAAAISAVAQTPPSSRSPSAKPSPRSRPPVLERFTAQFDTTTGGTRYTAVARDPDGGAVAYRWSLKATCGRLGNPRGTGPTNTYEHGPGVQRPDGCPGDAERAAVLTVTIADASGCAIEYTQGARDETVHVRPRTRALPCPSPAAASKGGGFPTGLIVLFVIVVVVGGSIGMRRARRPVRPPGRVAGPRQPAGAPPAAAGEADEMDDWLPAPSSEFEPFEGCLEGSVQNEATEVVAHESVLAGPIVVVSSGDAGTRSVELTESTETTRAELAASLGVAPGRVLEIRADVSVRLVTAICERREVCRAGRWMADVSSNTREGPERVEVLRATASSSEAFDRFVDEVLAPRVASLRRGRRRVDAALERCRAEPARTDAPSPAPEG